MCYGIKVIYGLKVFLDLNLLFKHFGHRYMF